MSDNQQPKPYDAVLGNQNQPAEGAAVLGGIESVKLLLSNSNPKVRIAALQQALNYGESGLDLIIEALQDEVPQVQIKAYSLLIPLSKKLERALQELEPIEVVTVNRHGDIIQRQQRLAKYFIEDLGNHITLEMAYIPGGSFMMGSHDNYKHGDWERPQHQVTIRPFYMGKFTVTQKQWESVAKLPKIERKLKLSCSCDKGDNRPVERVSWYDAAEFCVRLSKATGKEYRLPSEAEWEYACRAGTTTPFHYGETITNQLANYRADKTYADEPKGEPVNQTTVVGQFPPNAFGLYDMHGNVEEWSQDISHWNYEGAPTDGSAWIDDNNPFHYLRVLRGGSWFDAPWKCRSASHPRSHQRDIRNYRGFRVVCDLF